MRERKKETDTNVGKGRSLTVIVYWEAFVQTVRGEGEKERSKKVWIRMSEVDDSEEEERTGDRLLTRKTNSSRETELPRQCILIIHCTYGARKDGHQLHINES